MIKKNKNKKRKVDIDMSVTMNLVAIGAILLAALGTVFLIAPFIYSDKDVKDIFPLLVLSALCWILLAVTIIAEQKIRENEEKVETRLVLEENYKDYVPMDNNTFYWNDKVYEYELSKNKTELIVKCRENGTENATAYELEEEK